MSHVSAKLHFGTWIALVILTWYMITASESKVELKIDNNNGI